MYIIFYLQPLLLCPLEIPRDKIGVILIPQWKHNGKSP